MFSCSVVCPIKNLQPHTATQSVHLFGWLSQCSYTPQFSLTYFWCSQACHRLWLCSTICPSYCWLIHAFFTLWNQAFWMLIFFFMLYCYTRHSLTYHTLQRYMFFPNLAWFVTIFKFLDLGEKILLYEQKLSVSSASFTCSALTRNSSSHVLHHMCTWASIKALTKRKKLSLHMLHLFTCSAVTTDSFNLPSQALQHNIYVLIWEHI